jgi:hypothetical protein
MRDHSPPRWSKISNISLLSPISLSMPSLNKPSKTTWRIAAISTKPFGEVMKISQLAECLHTKKSSLVSKHG